MQSQLYNTSWVFTADVGLIKYPGHTSHEIWLIDRLCNNEGTMLKPQTHTRVHVQRETLSPAECEVTWGTYPLRQAHGTQHILCVQHTYNTCTPQAMKQSLAST